MLQCDSFPKTVREESRTPAFPVHTCHDPTEERKFSERTNEHACALRHTTHTHVEEKLLLTSARLYLTVRNYYSFMDL